ncbi:MAG: EF-hand domain-containing protein [Sedimenticola sp.]|nr:EF-hand domain-containing protein [Sedimenticola sp.]
MKTYRRRMTWVLAITTLLSAGTASAQMQPNPPGPLPFSTYDANGDGRVTAEEYYAARNERIAERAKQGRLMKNLGNAPSFEQFDHDGDGYLTELEMVKGQLDQMQQRPQRAMGRGAGRQSAGMARFGDFDLNGDGIVKPDEFDQVRAERQSSKAVQGYPMRNADTAPSFESFDSDGDGVLTPDEFVPGNRQPVQ